MSTPAANLKINSSRLWDSLMEMAKIGPGVPGGNNRQTLTDEDAEGRELFQKWCDKENLEMGVDKMGTMFARREGTDPNALPVYVGSHLDTQPTGGKYDGVLGVLGGLEIIRTLNELDIRTKHPIVVVNFTNEEGTRFAPPMMASGVFAGVHELQWAYDRKDAAGKTFGEEIKRIGWIGDEEVGSRKMHAFFELHIEQGPILEAENTDIGVVTHGQGLNWIQVTLNGRESHTGSTPMPMRKNAGLGMARITELVQDDMEKRLYEGAKKIASDLELTVEFEKVGHFDPVTFDEGCVDKVRRAAERLGYSHKNIISGAGHDACWINKVAPTAMIMCPCVDGLSHNEAEEISEKWASAGADVLLHAVLEAAEIV